MARTSWLGEVFVVALRQHFCRTLVLLFVVLACVTPALAKTFDATGQPGGTGNFSNVALWSGGPAGLPQAGDPLVIKGICVIDAAMNDSLDYGSLKLGQGSDTGSIEWGDGTKTLSVTVITSGKNGSSIDMTGGGTLEVHGSWNTTTAELTFTPGAGTVRWNADTASSTLPSFYGSYNNLIIATGSQAVGASTSFSVTGTMDVASGTFNPLATTLITSAAGTLSGAGTINVTQAALTDEFSAQYDFLVYDLQFLTVNFVASGEADAIDYGSVTVAAGATITTSGDIGVSGTLTVDGTLIPGVATLINSGGPDGTLTGAGTVTVTGISGTNDFSAQYNMAFFTLTSLTVEYAGTDSQGLSDRPYGTLKINNADGVSFSGFDATASALNLTAGTLNTDSNRLSILTASPGAVAHTGGYVIGTLRRAIGTALGTYLFPIGRGAVYAPASLAFAAGLAGDVDASTADGDHLSIAASSIDPAKSVNRTWTLAGLTGRSYDATFTFAPTDLDPSANTSAFVVRRFESSVWNTTTTGSRTTTSTQATGLTTNGDFAIGQQELDHFVVLVTGPRKVGEVFPATVTAQDSLNDTVVDSTTVVTMSSNGDAEFDSNGDTVFNDSTRTLSNGSFVINTRDLTADVAPLTITATAGLTTGTSLGITINKAATTTTVTSAATVFGETANFDAHVTVNSPGGGTPTGFVAFDDGETPISGCTAVPLNGTAHAICSTSTLSRGAHTINATYSESANYLGSTDDVSHTVNFGNVTVAVASSVNPSAVGESVNFTATVSATSPAAGTPTGTVTFKDGGTPLCTDVTLAGGAAGCTTSALTGGLHSITVEYSGDVNFDDAISATFSQVVGVSNAPTFLVKDINAGAPGSAPASITAMSDGRAIFSASTATAGTEPWVSDGTTLGTTLLKDLEGGISNSSPSSYIVFSGATFFTANTAASGLELWKSDGTTNGTTLFKEINPGGASSSPSSLVVSNGSLFFAAEDGTNASELWKSNGNSAGTQQVLDINPGAPSSTPASLTDKAGTLFFSADTPTFGRELWKSDGIDTGTTLVADVDLLATSSTPRELLVNDGMLFFVADGTTPNELWVSDGLLTTTRVKDINTLGGDGVTGLTTLASGIVVFSANDGLVGDELWSSDGTAGNTNLVKDINPSGNGLSGFSSTNGTAVVAGGVLYFWADDGVNGVELWKSNGTEAGTSMIVDLCPGACSSSPNSLTASGNDVFFSATNPVTGRELWITDGTAAGTQLVIDIEAGNGSSSPTRMKKIGSLLYFAATTAGAGEELFATCLTSTTQYGITGPSTAVAAAASTLTVVARDASAALVPCYTGTVHFTSSDPLATLSSDYHFTAGEGFRDFSFTLRTLGAQTITATDVVTGSITATLNVTVNGATSTALSSSVNPSALSQNVTFTANVTSASAGTITGSVTFRDGAIVLATVPLTGGSAQFSTASLTEGTHPITAEYLGAGNFNGSTSTVLNQVVTQVTFGPPPNLVATATGSTTATLTWLPVNSATSYEIFRSPNLNDYVLVGTNVGNGSTVFNDSGLSANTTYLYKVRAKREIGNPTETPFSAVDATTTVVFTDPSITAGTTLINAVHITQLRTAVNAFRAAVGLSTASFTDPTLSAGVFIKRVHITELRTAIDQARAVPGFLVLSYTDPTLTVGVTTAKRAHVTELRAGTL
jgi:ELWxxDGT repeat protein